MQIVIDISEDVFTRLFDNGIQDNEIAVDDVCEMARALRLGTPLPPHGRLIDANNLNEQEIPATKINGVVYVKLSTLQDLIDKAPTILEATKGEKE